MKNKIKPQGLGRKAYGAKNWLCLKCVATVTRKERGYCPKGCPPQIPGAKPQAAKPSPCPVPEYHGAHTVECRGPVEAWQIPPRKVVGVEVVAFYPHDYPSQVVRHAVVDRIMGPSTDNWQNCETREEAETVAANRRAALRAAGGAA